MGADEFDEGYLPAKVESDDQTIVSSQYGNKSLCEQDGYLAKRL
jgi:hypothetical protein